MRPDLVNMRRAVDYILPEADVRRYRRGSALLLTPMSAGSVGEASRATAEKGRELYEFIRAKIRERVFQANGARTD